MNYNQCLKEIEPNNEKEIFNLKVKFDIDLKNVISKINERNISMDIISINTVIESLFNQNRLDDAWNLYINLKNIKPDLYTYLAFVLIFIINHHYFQIILT
jgi:pentatricopeptide repeat protein